VGPTLRALSCLVDYLGGPSSHGDLLVKMNSGAG
jgi:hypothetical protein